MILGCAPCRCTQRTILLTFDFESARARDVTGHEDALDATEAFYKACEELKTAHAEWSMWVSIVDALRKRVRVTVTTDLISDSELSDNEGGGDDDDDTCECEAMFCGESGEDDEKTARTEDPAECHEECRDGYGYATYVCETALAA